MLQTAYNKVFHQGKKCGNGPLSFRGQNPPTDASRCIQPLKNFRKVEMSHRRLMITLYLPHNEMKPCNSISGSSSGNSGGTAPRGGKMHSFAFPERSKLKFRGRFFSQDVFYSMRRAAEQKGASYAMHLSNHKTDGAPHGHIVTQ